MVILSIVTNLSFIFSMLQTCVSINIYADLKDIDF